MAKMQENTDRDLGQTSEEIINECMVLSALQSTELALAVGPAQGPDHHLVQGLAAARPDRRLPRPREADRPAAPPRADRGRHGDEGPRLVRLGDGRAPERGHRRHDPRLAHAAARAATAARRSTPRASCCSRSASAPSRRRVTACPGCGRTTSTTFQELAERIQGYIRDQMPDWKTRVRGRREHDARRHGLRRQRPRRVEGRLDRHLAARHRRGAALPRLHRRPALHDAEGHLRRARRRPSARSWTTTSRRSTPGTRPRPR